MSCTTVVEAAVIEAADLASEFSPEESDLIKADVAAVQVNDALQDQQVADWDRYWSHR